MILPIGARLVFRGAAAGRGDLSCAEEGAEGRRPQYQRRRRRRLCAQSAIAPKRRSTSSSRRSRRRAIKPGEDIALALDPAVDRVLQERRLRLEGEGKSARSAEQVDYLAELVARLPIVSIEDGMAEDDLGRLEAADRQDRRQMSSWSGTICSSPTSTRLAEGIKLGHRQLDADQGQSDRHADRDAGRGRSGPPRRLHRGHVASLRRDRGHDHRRPRGRDQLRADQDRLAVALRPLAKYNQLLRIEEELGPRPSIAGRSALKALA